MPLLIMPSANGQEIFNISRISKYSHVLAFGNFAFSRALQHIYAQTIERGIWLQAICHTRKSIAARYFLGRSAFSRFANHFATK